MTIDHDCCTPTIARISPASPEIKCTCGALYQLGPTPRCRPRVVEDPERVSYEPPAPRAPGERVSCVDEDPELVRVRRLLTELRPDASGPLSHAHDGRAAPHVEPPMGSLASRIRVQCSPEVPTVLPGAFASRARVTQGTAAAARVADLSRLRPITGAVLLWLQRHGTLAAGLGALYRDVGEEFATKAEREAWTTTDRTREGQRAVGRRHVDEAATLWWGE